VKKQLQHIEDFVRGKLGLLEGDAQTDWLDFERKLRRATRVRQMKRAAGMVGVILLLGFSQAILSGDWAQAKLDKYNAAQDLEDFKFEPKETSNLSYTASELDLAKTISPVAEAPTAAIQASEMKAKENPQTPINQVKVEPVLLALAEENVAAEEGLASQAEASLFREAVLPINALNGAAEVKDLKKGRLVKDGKITRSTNLPFDYEVPRRTVSYKDISLRKVGYNPAPKSASPYISPLQEKRPWTYSLNIYPNFAFREFKIDRQKRNLLHSDFIDAMQASEASGMNINIGFEVSKRIGPITYLNTGIEYINNSYNAEYDFVNFRQANFDPDGEIVNYTLLRDPQRITFSDLNSFHFLNVPLSISYQPWATDHLRVNLEFGFSMLYFLEANGSTIDYRTLQPIDLSERSYRKYMASSSLKIGVQYYLSPNMNIGFEPTLMYFTNSIYTEEYPFEVIPYSLGLNLNLQMKLQ